ncbi:flagellar basal body rod protein FlgB [Bryobacter aggregatus]|uniref:flagellar basal body rod protein FlgB n=1 Tax=Bryobacter aggregatus TaxID=360054 RepID=UPI000AC95E05|nr:flagellar basal body protein [Bryobacter aggregatus]
MFDPLTGRMAQYLDLLADRQKLVAANIANADTPGYKTKDIDFHFEFQSLLDGAAPHVIEPEGLKTKNDGNNVDVDREMRLLSENSMRFNLVSQLVKGDARDIRLAIKDARG